MKRIVWLTILPVLLLAGCASSKSAQSAGLQATVTEKHDTFDLIAVPYEDFGYAWSYQTYVRPHYPTGVAKDIYEKIWAC
jgi:hypothetical protein